jgi:hypothetical protein
MPDPPLSITADASTIGGLAGYAVEYASIIHKESRVKSGFPGDSARIPRALYYNGSDTERARCIRAMRPQEGTR